MGCPRSGGPGLLAFAPAARFGRRGRLLGLEPGRNRLGLGPPLAARRLLLLVALGLRLDAGLRGVRHAFALLGRLAQRRLPARSEEHTSELQSQSNLVCRLLLEKKKRTSTS